VICFAWPSHVSFGIARRPVTRSTADRSGSASLSVGWRGATLGEIALACTLLSLERPRRARILSDASTWARAPSHISTASAESTTTKSWSERLFDVWAPWFAAEATCAQLPKPRLSSPGLATPSSGQLASRHPSRPLQVHERRRMARVRQQTAAGRAVTRRLAALVTVQSEPSRRFDPSSAASMRFPPETPKHTGRGFNDGNSLKMLDGDPPWPLWDAGRSGPRTCSRHFFESLL
jgi:hypothetical protein